MTASVNQDSLSTPHPAGATCPGASTSSEWDEPTSLRGELVTPERIDAHAAEVARAHAGAVPATSPGPLRRRFVEARAKIRDAYAILAKTSHAKREPSPAEEWLLDNWHIVEDQLREVEDDLPAGYLMTLPRLGTGPMADYPCVYGLCLDYLRHSDARVDFDSLVRYVRAYQTERALTIGELWAVPIMLRIGLLLTVGSIASEEAHSDHRARGDEIAARLLAPIDTSEGAAAMEGLLGELQPSAPLLVHLLRRLHEHEAPVGAAFDWIRAESAKLGMTPDELARRQHLKQAADQVSVGNAITSMRAIAALDWNLFFDITSTVEATLCRDPAKEYAATNKGSRNEYRHAIEDMARRSDTDEQGVAALALELAEGGMRHYGADSASAHVGFYLVAEGRAALEHRIDYRPTLRERAQRAVLKNAELGYIGAVTCLAFAIAALFGVLALRAHEGWVVPALVAIPAFLAASEISVTIVNLCVTWLLPPRRLPKLALKEGIPAKLTTLVVVPVLLDSTAGIEQMLQDLEVRALANLEQNLYFALLTDHVDAESEHHADDGPRLALVRQGIEALNKKYPTEGEPRFHLFHRRRLENRSQGCWMGWERKRGKLEELNQLLIGGKETTFDVVTATPKLLRSFRFVITLDADTQLPRDTARRLVATIAHPLNRPRVKHGAIVEGYAVIQPRVGTDPSSARRSRFARVMAGPPGIDPYTTAVSDVYQDLFAEGAYVGKAIYDVAAFASALADRVPDNALLSHDLFEGLHARTALATDIELLDDQPSSYSVAAKRLHRWVRGDWQLLPWLGRRTPRRGGSRGANDISIVGRWKLFDNLRRSVVAPALIVLLVLSWVASLRAALTATAFVLAALFAPLIGTLFVVLARPPDSRPREMFSSMWGDVRANGKKAGANLIFLLDRGVVVADAILRTIYRLFVSRRLLLSWQTTQETEHRLLGHTADERRFVSESVATILVGIALAFTSPGTFIVAAPLLVAWGLAPWIAAWLSRPLPSPGAREVTEKHRRELRSCARKTWHFFEAFVTAGDNWLPPDNYQEEPRGVVAHRTSPTNIGLYLLSTGAAHDFGFLTVTEMTRRIENTLGTLEQLEKHQGHILNWYDTVTLHPLEPRYVSTVDSGNLAAYLLALRVTLDEARHASLVKPSAFEALRDVFRLVSKTNGLESPDGAALSELASELERIAASPPRDLAPQLTALHELDRLLREAFPNAERISFGLVRPHDVDWKRELHRSTERWIHELETLAPWAPGLDAALTALQSCAPQEDWAPVFSRLGAATSLSAIGDAVSNALPQLRAKRTSLAAHLELDPALCKKGLEVLSDLLSKLEESRDACEALANDLSRTDGRIATLVDGMDFRFLYNPDRHLFAIGYNVSSGRLDTSHYDLLASEARLASLFAIARGQVPQEHWFHLGRPRAALGQGRVLLSWSGSMFEYLMPLLVMKSYRETLLDETLTSAVAGQQAYGEERRVPWGISESAFNVMDMGMTYQYRAFGVPWLGFKPGLKEDLVVAPYATVLASQIVPDLAAENLERLTQEGAEGAFGYYEAVDYTPAHVPPGKRGVVVKAYMAHHQGMSLVALDNALNGTPMQRRFHDDARIKATELLLEERVPVRAPLVEHREALFGSPVPTPDVSFDAVEQVDLTFHGPPRLHLLGHGELSTVVTTAGTGVTTWRGLDIHRYREDTSVDAYGLFIYVRDISSGALWSAGYEPTRKTADHYAVDLSVDKVVIRRRDGDIETVTEIGVSPEQPAEVRRVTVTNHADAPREIEVTSYTEVVLAPRNADIAHRAFGDMFVETEALPQKSAMMARRRSRSPGESDTWLIQLLTEEEGTWDHFEFDCSRARFIGRGRTVERPSSFAGDEPLAGHAGEALDPALILRKRIVLGPGESARLALCTALAPSHELAVELVDAYAAPSIIARTFELGWADARVELKHLGMTAAQASRSQRLLSAVLFPQPVLRAALAPSAIQGSTRDALWAHGISGDLPILVVRIDSGDFERLCREVLVAHEFWRVNGVPVDLVILNEEASSYMQPAQQQLLALIAASPARGRMEQRGGVFVVRADQCGPAQRPLLLCAARVVLLASLGSLARQLRRASDTVHDLPARKPVPVLAATTERPSSRPPEELAFDNGLGGFADGGREYVIRVGAGTRTPAPWCNVLANARFGALVSESGASFTWALNSQSHRLTPWSNDAVSDPPGEAIYLRDEATGEVWSPTPLPAGGEARFEVRHGQGYSVFHHSRGDLEHELTLFVDREKAVKVLRLRIRNGGKERRDLRAYGIVEWVLGSSRERSRLTVVSEIDPSDAAIIAFNPGAVFADRRAFFASTNVSLGATTDREEFFGRFGSRGRPAALDRAGLSGRAGAGLDPCAAIMVDASVAPGETSEVVFLLGDALNREEAQATIAELRRAGAVDEALSAVTNDWNAILDTVQVKTPDAALDLMVNRWLLYQALAARIWARSGFYQSGGAYGFRDQLQDVMALLVARPEIAREHILRSAARQFEEGDVQHWWHPETGEGVRTRCSDDMLWLPYVTAAYVRTTGDAAILDERVPFLEERRLREDEHDLFRAPSVSQTWGTIYEHCARALEAGATEGSHGLPLMRGGDWNDGMNRVGVEGKGESVWLAWFLAKTCRDFAAVATERGDSGRAAWCEERATALGKAVDQHAWDGEWYLRAYFDDGTPVGSQASVECKVDAIAQSWATISGIGDAARARQGNAKAIELLFGDGILRLFTPPFAGKGPDPGYIRAYPPGLRENAGQYTHGVLWTVLAEAISGEGDKAVELLSALNPIEHALNAEAARRYAVEPYVVAADVYGGSGLVGRGGWTWYTGSAAWMYRIAVESILGIVARGDKLTFSPCIPKGWRSFEVTVNRRGGRLHILVENPHGLSRGRCTVAVDGVVTSDGRAPLDGKNHEVHVLIGAEDEGSVPFLQRPEPPESRRGAAHVEDHHRE